MNMCLCRRIRISAGYTMYGKISYILPAYDTITVSSDFGQSVSLEILVLSEKLPPLIKELTEITNGTVKVEDIEELYEDFSSVRQEATS